MLVKIISLFFVFIAILAIFGRLRFPGQKRLAALKCRGCGRYRIGRAACPCGRGT